MPLWPSMHASRTLPSPPPLTSKLRSLIIMTGIRLLVRTGAEYRPTTTRVVRQHPSSSVAQYQLLYIRTVQIPQAHYYSISHHRVLVSLYHCRSSVSPTASLPPLQKKIFASKEGNILVSTLSSITYCPRREKIEARRRDFGDQTLLPYLVQKAHLPIWAF